MDVMCEEDLDLYGRDIDDPMSELAQDIQHILLEDFGSNCDDHDRSVGLERALSGSTTSALGAFIEGKLTRDPRIDSARVTVTPKGAGAYEIRLLVQANGSELGLAFSADGSGLFTRLTDANS